MDDYIAMSFPKLLSPITHLQGDRMLETLVKDILEGKQMAEMQNEFLHLSEEWRGE